MKKPNGIHLQLDTKTAISAIAKTEYQKTQFDTIKLEDLGFSYPTENSITVKSI